LYYCGRYRNAIDTISMDTLLYGPYTYGIGGVINSIPNSLGAVKLEVYDLDFGKECSRDTVVVEDCQCALDIISATPSQCNPLTDEFSLEVVIEHDNIQDEDILITLSTGESQVFSTIDGTEVFILNGLTPTGTSDIDVSVELVLDDGCTNELLQAFDSPSSCSTDTNCSVFFESVVASGCYITDGQSLVTVSAEISWQDVGTGNITVELEGQTRTIVPGVNSVTFADGSSSTVTISSPQVVAFEIPADGLIHDITATLSTDASCNDERSFTGSPPCLLELCDEQILGGIVYYDYNSDGIKDAGETFGLADVDVTATSPDGSTFFATTDNLGNYNLFIPSDKFPVRVEFENLPTEVDQGTLAGINNGTTVQFADEPDCNYHLGVLFKEDFCDTDPLIILPCYITGDPDNGAVKDGDALVAFPYDMSGLKDPSSMHTLGTVEEVGATWGVAYNRFTNKIYSAATLKRHTGLASGGLGGVYESDLADLPNVSANLFINVETDLGIDVGNADVGSNADRGIVGGLLDPSRDNSGYIYSGKRGIGDMDFSSDGNTLYFTNMKDKKLYIVDITDYNNSGVKPTSANVTSVTLPEVCEGGDLRPWAVKKYRTEIFVGAICDASSSGGIDDLRAVMFRIETANANTVTEVLNLPLGYSKGFPMFANRGNTGWYPWTDDWSQKVDLAVNFGSANGQGGAKAIIHPEPVFADIEFDIDGSVILVLNDRAGLQSGNRNYSPTAAASTDLGLPADQLYDGYIGGDILRAYFSNGRYVLENNGNAGPNSGAGLNNSQGPGFGEFYNDNSVVVPAGNLIAHAENVMGGAGMLPGSGEVVVAVLDPVDLVSGPEFYAGGVRHWNNTTGMTDLAYQVYASADGR